jgi:hypothetical protein
VSDAASIWPRTDTETVGVCQSIISLLVWAKSSQFKRAARLDGRSADVLISKLQSFLDSPLAVFRLEIDSTSGQPPREAALLRRCGALSVGLSPMEIEA